MNQTIQVWGARASGTCRGGAPWWYHSGTPTASNATVRRGFQQPPQADSLKQSIPHKQNRGGPQLPNLRTYTHTPVRRRRHPPSPRRRGGASPARKPGCRPDSPVRFFCQGCWGVKLRARSKPASTVDAAWHDTHTRRNSTSSAGIYRSTSRTAIVKASTNRRSIHYVHTN